MATALNANTHRTPARQPLLWIVPLTLIWTLLITWEPAITTSAIPAAAVRLMVHGVIALGLWLALERTDFSPQQRRRMWLWIMAALTLWLAAAWSAAVKGVFTIASGPPLLPLAIFGPVFLGAPLLLLSRRVGQLLDAMPAGWLVGLQAYRVFGATFLAAAIRGTLPGLFGYTAGIGDALTGIFALPVAIAVASDTVEGRRAAKIWNFLGLADLGIAITLGVITSPGPFQLIVSSAPSIGTAGYPYVLTPAFAVPSSILLHLLSLRLLMRREIAK